MEKSAPPPPYSQTEHYPPPGFNAPQPQQTGYNPPPPQPQAFPAQQPGYGLPSGQPAVVMVAGPGVTVFGPNSQTTACPHCHHQITTRVESEAGSKTHLFALILCLFGCIPCCLIPYCTDSCQNQNHYCPSCGAFLGTYTN